MQADQVNIPPRRASFRSMTHIMNQLSTQAFRSSRSVRHVKPKIDHYERERLF